MGTIRNILIDVPHIDSAPLCIERVKGFAKRQGARLTLMTVLPSFADLFALFDSESVQDNLQDGLEKQANDFLSDLSEDLSQHGLNCSTLVSKGVRTRWLIRRVIKEEHDLLIKDASPEDQGKILTFGAIDHRLVRQCPCPVWLLREQAKPDAETQVVLAVDGNLEDPIHRELNQRLIRYARAVASERNCQLHVVHVWDFDSSGLVKGSVSHSQYTELRSEAAKAAQDRIDAFAKKMSLSSSDATVHLSEGAPSRAIIKYCNTHPVDTLVIGSVGRAGLSGYLIGNTAERVMNSVTCSLLVVSPGQVESPLEVKLKEELADAGLFATA